jgi:SOUL heme-binding protein
MSLKHLVIVLGVTLAGAQAMAVEEPPFRTVTQDATFEVRDYPALVVAEVTVTGDQSEASNAGFRLLAGYIFGGNTRQQSIAMTAPVAVEPVSEKIAMTAPVLLTESKGAWVVRFTMPAGYTLQNLPKPNDPKVQLKAVPPARFAVITFSGLAGADTVKEKSAELLAQVNTRKLRATGPVSLARYDPPWTLWFMRRNEVMVPVGL